MKRTTGVMLAFLACWTLSLASQRKPEPQKPKRRPVVGRLEGFELASGQSVNKDAIRPGALRAPKDRLVALAPFLGRSLSETPTFCWRSTYPSSKATFILMDVSTKLFEAKVTGASFTYPGNAPNLLRGKIYSWQVEVPISDLESATSEPVQVQIVADVDAEALQKKFLAVSGIGDLDREIARAQILVDARLWYDVVDAYAHLLAKAPERADLFEKRGIIYAQIPVTQPESNADFAQAEKLAAR